MSSQLFDPASLFWISSTSESILPWLLVDLIDLCDDLDLVDDLDLWDDPDALELTDTAEPHEECEVKIFLQDLCRVLATSFNARKSSWSLEVAATTASRLSLKCLKC